MKVRVYLSVGALLLFLAPLSCSDKAESPAPETPPEEQPVQPSEEYKEMYHSMEDNIKDEEPSLYYTYFRMRNDSDQPLYIAARVGRNPYGFFYYLKPKEQATHWCCIENCAGLNFDMDQVLIKDLNKGLDYLEIYYRDDKAGTLAPEKDTAMLYKFMVPMTEESERRATRPVGSMKSSRTAPVPCDGRFISPMRTMKKPSVRPPNGGKIGIAGAVSR